MIRLAYQLSPSWNDPDAFDLSSVDTSELRYDLFLGDIEFLIGKGDFSARWGWIPVLDFVFALRSIARSLPETREENFEFTESDASLRFVYSCDGVTVTSNYAAEGIAAEVSYGKFRDAAEAFFSRMIDDLCGAYPELLKNPAMEALIAS